jgi:1,4-dihydroxy-2-naphthoate octaprenyltransferase
MKARIKAHLWTLPRWFATPFFAASLVLGGLLAGGMTINSWIGVFAGVLIMAGGHSFNSFLDYAWTGLDKGETHERSAEKNYSGGQSIIEKKVVSEKEVVANAAGWYFLAAIPITYLTLQTGWQVPVLGVLGMLVTFGYAKAKFNWTHELVLGLGIGPLPVLMGMFATSPHPPWGAGIAAGFLLAIVPSFAGLALDEWPDAEANLKKGVKSIAFKVWESGVSLEWYLSSWFLFMYLMQIFLINIGILAPLTGISFITWPFFMALLVLAKKDFTRMAGLIIIVGVSYPVLLVVGQAIGD